MTDLFLGYHDHNKLTMSATSLQRHFACFGSSGSGKTVVSKVLIEELARNGIPVIAFDPQGDIASLAELGNEADLERFNDLPEIRKSYSDTTEVLIWTPASTRGIPLSLNPFNFSASDGLNSEEKIRFLANAAKNITALIGYDPGKNDGRAVEASFIIMFEYAVEKNIPLNSFKDLISMMDSLPEPLIKSLNKVIDLKILDSVNQKLSLYTVGTNRLLFDLSKAVGIEDLLGLGSDSGKTRVSIIYLNTLHNPEEKEFVIAVITEMLYQWMLKNPLTDPDKALQCAYYIDEIAPYIPPVRKPACKESLTVLYKQARKYGVGCILSTQNPGDIDYKSIAQFSTMALGSLYTQQDIKKVRNRLDSLAPKDAERIANTLPGLEKGNFILLSPDNLKDVITMKSRWLVTAHKVLTEMDIDRLTDDRLRQFYLKKELSDETPVSIHKADQMSEDKSMTAGKDEILIVKPKFYEKDLGKELKSHLAGGMIKKEKVGQSVLKYFPLIKTHIQIEQKKGLFKNKTELLKENLYLTWKHMKITSFQKKKLCVDTIFDKNPDKITDIDDMGGVHAVPVQEIATDLKLDRLKPNEKNIRHTIENKYGVMYISAEILLYPYWNCTIESKKGDSQRQICIDAVTGYTIPEETVKELSV